ncbi:cysteine desulfurase-like protein [Labrenzia sp. PHM005]|uniref:cysteine desulfurase-like protein n=1 Tax=Labrenzia sp. PHM005 TaxID=2590016 RepID=UPI0011406B69|nr:cysteine desulfurase-like protein [Labrenzia sp. PHM005]QDG76318.1 cysteine desulfurase-like protein [Labrenzia sp. PHM005]
MHTNQPLDIAWVREQFPALRSDWVFFDNAGGSQILKPAVDRINEFLFQKNVQIGGSYELSQAAAAALMDARKAGQLLVNAARPEEIVFGHSTTVLVQNLVEAMRRQLTPGDEVIVTNADHESNIGPWRRLEEFGIAIKVWEIDPASLTLRLEDLDKLMGNRTRLVAVHHVSNILGEINPVREIADFVHERGARLCVDAVAYAPHRAIDVQAFDADYYIFSLYKTYGPHTAVMYGKYDLLLELDTLYHYFYGKEKVPGKLEAGNPNYELAYSLTGIVSYLQELGEKCGARENSTPRAKIEAAMAAIAAHENALTERFLSWARGRSVIKIIGQETIDRGTRIPTIAFTAAGWSPEGICREIDHARIAIRHGDFHSRRLIEELALSKSGGVVRVSMVHYNTLDEIDRLTDALDAVLDAGASTAADQKVSA